MNSDELSKLYGKISSEIDGYIHAGDIDNLKNMDLLCGRYIDQYPLIAYAFWYCKANIASALFQLGNLQEKPPEPQNIEPQDKQKSNKTKQSSTIQVDPSWKPLLYQRQAIQHDSFQACSREFKAMILTNTGRAFDKIGRFIEAIECYEQAILCVPTFAMALYYRGRSLFKLANWLALNPEINYNKTPFNFLYIEAKKSFNRAFQKGTVWETHPDNIDTLRKEYYEYILPHIHQIGTLEAIKSYKLCFVYFFNKLVGGVVYKLNFMGFLKDSAEKVAYKKWSLKEHLYLDPINLVSVYDIGRTDYLSFPPYSYRQGEEQPEFFNWFRLLKQEYIAARYLLFQSIQLKDKEHFADENSDLFPSNEAELKRSDNSGEIRQNDFSFGLTTSLMKSSFSKAYSIFDKIAEFIFAFWELEVKNKKGEVIRNPMISIGSIWYNNLDSKQGVNIKLINKDNWFLKGLYHLSYDLVGKEIPKAYILPEFKRLHEIRNKLEHSGVMITKEINTSSSQRLMTISLEEFVEHNLSLLRLVRNALFYLSLAAGLDQWNYENRINNTYQEND
ncbi:LA2681 family HEPN domain-containing protein [Commensalibacter intestini]|nr:LA2681 family HEPN domain-containing protein [Commensalibacter intestini]